MDKKDQEIEYLRLHLARARQDLAMCQRFSRLHVESARILSERMRYYRARQCQFCGAHPPPEEEPENPETPG